MGQELKMKSWKEKKVMDGDGGQNRRYRGGVMKMKAVRYFLHATIWAVWMDTNKSRWVLPLLKWINQQREKRGEIGDDYSRSD